MEKEEFNQKDYIKGYNKENYSQFKAYLKKEEKKEIDEYLNQNNLSKSEFILHSYIKVMEENRMKIQDLYKINILDRKAALLLNNNIDNSFYDNYMFKDLEWLLENQNKIESDFNNNIDKLKFDIILNSNLDERINLIINLKNGTIEEFSNYINYIPYQNLDQKDKNDMMSLFYEFRKINDTHELIEFFEKFRRR